MKTSLFSYDLPESLIAQHPAEPRDASRMLVVNRTTGRFEHRIFADLPDFLDPGDLLIRNETRVIHARILGRKEKTGGRVEFLFLEEREPGVWETMIRASRRPALGDRIRIEPGDTRVTLLEDGEQGLAIVRVEGDRPFQDVLRDHGEPPLPPYIKRKQGRAEALAVDRERYQTVYANREGAVAAPTAGLHFTPETFRRLDQRGVCSAPILLHVGIGTFLPVKTETVEDHRMFSERYEISDETAGRIRETRAAGGRVVAVGSTSVRTLEAAAGPDGTVEAGRGRTDLFIYPPYRFKAVDAVLTNFHLPCSTLIMMICAFAGRDVIMRAYREAVEQEYRFYSYGDCMLIL